MVTWLGKPHGSKNREEQDYSIPQASLQTKSWSLQEPKSYRSKDLFVSNYSCSCVTNKTMKTMIHHWHKHNAFSSDGKTSHPLLLNWLQKYNRSKNEAHCPAQLMAGGGQRSKHHITGLLPTPVQTPTFHMRQTTSHLVSLANSLQKPFKLIYNKAYPEKSPTVSGHVCSNHWVHLQSNTTNRIQCCSKQGRRYVDCFYRS